MSIEMICKNHEIVWLGYTDIRKAGTMVKTQKCPFWHNQVKYVPVSNDTFPTFDVTASLAMLSGVFGFNLTLFKIPKVWELVKIPKLSSFCFSKCFDFLHAKLCNVRPNACALTSNSCTHACQTLVECLEIQNIWSWASWHFYVQNVPMHFLCPISTLVSYLFLLLNSNIKHEINLF